MSDTRPQWEVRHNPEARRFEVDLGDALAVLEYTLDGERMVFTHTGVPKAYEGRGIASALVRAGLAYARQQGYKVVPVCSFVAAYLRRHPEEADLLTG